MTNYDQWKTASPPEYDIRCECGHLDEDHDESRQWLENNIEPLVTVLKEIDLLVHKSMSLEQLKLQILSHIADILTICGAQDCRCRKFVQAIEE